MRLRAARALHFEHRGHIDEHHVERMPARGAEYGEIQRRIRRKQRVHRADADEVRARGRGQPQHFREIGEIADAPVVLRTQRVELHRHAPESCARGQRPAVRSTCRASTISGQVSRPANSSSTSQAVITQRQILGQRQVAQHEPAAVLLVRTALGQIPGAHLAVALAAALELHASSAAARCVRWPAY